MSCESTTNLVDAILLGRYFFTLYDCNDCTIMIIASLTTYNTTYLSRCAGSASGVESVSTE